MNTVVRLTRSRSALSLLTLACLGSTCLSGAAFAQAQSDVAAVDEIVVTGTRVVRDGYEAPTPVSVIGIEQLENQATSNLADSINQLPTLVGSSTPQGSVANTTSGQGAINGLSLRGLGTSRTLVLLNGQRTVGSILTGVVDVSELPQSLIERVDVVTGGASAAYGSDALSGVVNFVLDTDFTGFKSELSGGITDYGDAPQYKINATYGTPFAGGRGHFLLSGEHSWENGLLIGDRPWNREGHSFINNPAYTPTNGLPALIRTTRVALGPIASWGGTIAAGPLKGTSFGPGGSIYQMAIGDIAAGQLMRGGSWEAQQIAPVRGVAFQPKQNRQDVFARVSYDVSDSVQVYAHAAWGHMGSYSTGAPNFFPGNLTLALDNAYLPAELRPALTAAGTNITFGTMNWDLDSFHAVYDRRVLRFLAGATGNFDAVGTDWTWDMYLSNGEAFGSLKSIGSMDRTRYALAVDAVRNPANGAIVCRSTLTNPGNGCVPYNVFGIGVNSQAAVDYIQGRYGWNNHRLNQKVAAISFTGNPLETWAGPVSTAFGYEYRAESMRQISDPEEQANPTMWFQAAGQPYTGQVKVNDVFFETVVPLAKDESWATALDLNGSVRGTHYSTYGWVGTWKVGATYNPVDDIRFRITQSRNIRSPTLVDLYQAGSTARSSVTDNGRTVNSQTTTRGNPNLGPEKSSDTGVGVVYQPGWFPGFSASVDYYRVKINDAVNQLGSTELLTLCQNGNQVACATFTRTGTIGQSDEQLNFTVAPQNFATERMKGIDFEASYSMPLSQISDSWDGNLGLRMLATHYISYTVFSGVPGDRPIEYAGAPGSSGSNIGGGGGGLPDWRVNSSINYSLDPVALGFTFRYISGGLNNATYIECQSGCPASAGIRLTTDNNQVESSFLIDFNSSYTMHFGETSEAELFFNVRNLFNTDPPIAVRGPGGSSWDFPPTNQGLYDIMGRIFRAGLKFKM